MENIFLLAAAELAIPVILRLIGYFAERIAQIPTAQFPPISDEEFLARCGPGTDPRVALLVRAIVADQLCSEEARIYPEHRFVEDLRAD